MQRCEGTDPFQKSKKHQRIPSSLNGGHNSSKGSSASKPIKVPTEMTMDSITESLSIIRARDVLLPSVVFTQPVMSLTFSEEQDFEIMRHRVEEEMKKNERSNWAL